MKKSIMPVALLFILIVTMTTAASASREDLFSSCLIAGDYAGAGEAARAAGAERPEFYALAAICLQNMALYDQANVYRHKYQIRSNPQRLQALVEELLAAHPHPQTDLLAGLVGTVFPETAMTASEHYLERARAAMPDNPYALNYRALHALKEGLANEAIQADLEHAIRQKSDFPEPYLNLAVLLYRKGQPDAAIATVLECLVHCPQVPGNAYHGLASLAGTEVPLMIQPYRESPYRIAAPQLREEYAPLVLERLAGCPEHLLGLAEYFASSGNPVMARTILAAAGDQPDPLLREYIMLLVANLEGNFNSVSATAQRLLEQGFSHYQRLLEAGNLFFYSGEFATAAEFYRQTLRFTHPDDDRYLMKAHSNLGAVLFMVRDYPGSIHHSLVALSIMADDPITLVNLGLAYRDSGRPEEARKCFEEALRYIDDPRWAAQVESFIAALK